MKTLKQFISECLAVDQPKPRLKDMANLETWHNGWVEAMQAEERELHRLIDRYAAILNGEPFKPVEGDRSSVLRGPWKSS